MSSWLFFASLPVLALAAASAQSATSLQAFTACQNLSDVPAMLSSRADATAATLIRERMATGECLKIPAGTEFLVERQSVSAACVMIIGFSHCLWTPDLAHVE